MLEAIAGLLGKGVDAGISYLNARNNIKYQKMFAQHGIRWKVQDAMAAGLHPLAALGAQTSSFSPVSIGSNFGEAGQDIARAMQAKTTEPERLSAVQKAEQDLRLQRLGLENQMLASQIAKVNQAGQPPPMPTLGASRSMDGQGQSPLVNLQPQDLQRVDPNKPGAEPGHVSDVAWTHNPDGTYSKIPSKEAKDRLEDFKLPQWQWFMRNQMAPSPQTESGPYPAPADHLWYTNPLTGKTWLAPERGRSRIDRFADPKIRRYR